MFGFAKKGLLGYMLISAVEVVTLFMTYMLVEFVFQLKQKTLIQKY